MGGEDQCYKDDVNVKDFWDSLWWENLISEGL